MTSINCVSSSTSTVIDDIEAWEHAYIDSGHVPGTRIERVLAPVNGWRWAVSLGTLDGIKMIGYGVTVREAFEAAQQSFPSQLVIREMGPRSRKRKR